MKKNILLILLIAGSFTLFLAFKFYEQPRLNGNVVKYKWLKDWPHLAKNYVLGNPTGMAIDSEQNLWVFIRAGRTWSEPMPDSLIPANTILKLDRKSGKILKAWGADLFVMPHGLSVDKDDNIWVTDVGLHQLFKFSPDGELLLKLGMEKVAGNDSLHFNLPTDVAIADDGSIYVSDGYGNSRVVKFSAAGKYLLSWGSKGRGKGQFDVPHAIDLDAEGNVYVADRENNRIQKFDANGKFLEEWGDESFGKMYSVAIDKSNNDLIAVDYVKTNGTPIGSDILLYSSLKDQLNQFGRSGSYDGPVCRYHDLAIDNEGSIYVGDILGNTIQKFKRVVD